MTTISIARAASLESDRGHPLPRRASPEASVTMQNHRQIRRRPGDRPRTAPVALEHGSSSDDSGRTGHSDTMSWFEQSNKGQLPVPNSTSLNGEPTSKAPHLSQSSAHPFDTVDPPFFQKHSESNEETRQYIMPDRADIAAVPRFRPGDTHSSSADDYRNIIDDLTIENKKLKEELKRFKRLASGPLKDDRLFEVKVHGLPSRKKRELEATLRDFASGVIGRADPPSQWKKLSTEGTQPHGSSSSSSKSQSRPTDSAYASMSTELTVPSSKSAAPAGLLGRDKAKVPTHQKPQSYLVDVPQGLGRKTVTMAEKEKKKWVVRRLEQLFTGKLSGKNVLRDPLRPIMPTEMSSDSMRLVNMEPSREALMDGAEPKTSRLSAERPAASTSDGEDDSRGQVADDDQSGGNEKNTVNTSPPDEDIPAQRPTRPRDLDPDRVQNPSANMDYIRHLGATAPEGLSESIFKANDVSMDAKGWIHLNLLCSMAQLHIYNVTPSFVRAAVSEKSTKFQLSRDGSKIRWRGGTEGTKFSGESSGSSSQRSPSDSAEDNANHDVAESPRKRQKLASDDCHQPNSHSSTKPVAKLIPQTYGPSESCHYRPLFVRRSSTEEDENTLSESQSQMSFGPVMATAGMRKRNDFLVHSASGSSQRKKRRVEGAVTYYSGAPFCTDLAGDAGDVSSREVVSSADQDVELRDADQLRGLQRTESGSLLKVHPLTQGGVVKGMSTGTMSTTGDDESLNGACFETSWIGQKAAMVPRPLEARLEPSGLGGVMPEDHFCLSVLTSHPINPRPLVDETDHITRPLAQTTTKSPKRKHNTQDEVKVTHKDLRLAYQQIAIKHKSLEPMPLPPATMFLSPSSDSSDESEEDAEERTYDGSEDNADDNEDEDDSTSGEPTSDAISSHNINMRRSFAHKRSVPSDVRFDEKAYAMADARDGGLSQIPMVGQHEQLDSPYATAGDEETDDNEDDQCTGDEAR